MTPRQSVHGKNTDNLNNKASGKARHDVLKPFDYVQVGGPGMSDANLILSKATYLFADLEAKARHGSSRSTVGTM